MKRLILKMGIICLSYSWILICVIYWIQGESIILLQHDIKYLFVENRKTLYAIAISLFVIVLFCFYAILNGEKILRFRWDIRIGGFQWKLGALKSFYASINRIMIGGGCGALVILVGVILFHGPLNGNGKVVDDTWKSYPIAHAMGAIDGYDYTNSLEAFEYNYELGQRVFEVDFNYTSDGKIVCVHSWNQGYWEGIDKDHIPSEEVLKATPILGKYTTLTLEDLLQLMKEYEDIYIVTDTKIVGAGVIEQFEYILNIVRETGSEDVLDRVIVQIYNEKMLQRVKRIYNFPTIIYTLYRSGWDGRADTFFHFCRFCKSHDIQCITMWSYLATPEVLQVADSYGISVFVHTVNDLENAKELIQDGVKGVYTDELTPDMFLQEE